MSNLQEISRECNNSREAQSRFAIEQLSRKQTCKRTIQTVYKAGYTEVTVKSIFNGKERLESLFYEILQAQLTNYNESVVQL